VERTRSKLRESLHHLRGKYIIFYPEKTLEKLLNKIDESANNATSKEVQFQQSLRDILKKYKISSDAFEAEVINLHRQS
jgi:hypothetical protein